MAIEMAAGFKIYSTDAVDSRFVMSKAEMLSLEELAYPSTYFCVCTDDKSLYVFDSTNTYDASTGKFRIASGGGSYVLPAATDTTLGGVMVDNVTITVDENGLITGIDAYTKTEVDDLLNTKLDKEKVVQNLDVPDAESVLSTEATQAALDTKVDKVEGSSLVPDTEIAKIHEHVNMTTLDKFSENALGELLYNGSLIASADPEGDAGAEGNWITNTKIGNLEAGTDVTGLTAIQIWKIASVAYENPTASVAYSQTNTIIENGQTFNLDITVSNVKKGTGEVSKIDLYKGGVLVESLPYVAGTSSYSFTQIADVSTDTSLEVRVYDDADKYSKYTKSYDFVNPYYYGCLDNIPVDATGMTKLVEAKGNKTITNTTSPDGQYITFMYDAAYGNLSSIIDPSGFECMTGFTKIQLTIGEVQYNCYYSTLKQVISNFKYTYKY